MKLFIDTEVLKKYLPEDMLAALIEAVRITRKNYMADYRRGVRITRKNYTESCKNYGNSYEGDVRITDSENAEICPETAFSAGNGSFSGDFSASRGEGGRGVGCTVTGPDAKLSFKSNLSYAKENCKNYTKEEKKEYNEKLREEFDKYWFTYPEAGRMNYEGCFKRFKVIRRTIPAPAFVRGFIKSQQEKWEAIMPNYVPLMLRFLEAEDWAKMEASAKAKIERNIDHWKKVVEIEIAKCKMEAG
jgi:hypothetical protein